MKNTSAFKESIKRAISEDIGNGDITASLIPESQISVASLISREAAIIAGIEWFNAVFKQICPDTEIHWKVVDGDKVVANTLLCEIKGQSRGILTAERTALNFLQTMSGTATKVSTYVQAIKGTSAMILDTRKTLPGLRNAQKYAVTCGGGKNHRQGLYDGILIKENHILAAGSIAQAVTNAKALGSGMPIEVEVENLDELTQALEAKADIVLLDNMPPPLLRQAVALNRGQVKLEASGGITLENIRAIADTGVDYLSIGAVTKDVKAIDLSMRFNTLSI